MKQCPVLARERGDAGDRGHLHVEAWQRRRHSGTPWWPAVHSGAMFGMVRTTQNLRAGECGGITSLWACACIEASSIIRPVSRARCPGAALRDSLLSMEVDGG